MAEQSKVNILDIIKKHIGSVVFAIYRKDGGVAFLNDKIINTTPELLTLLNTKTNEQVAVPYFELNGSRRVLALYNSNLIDLLKLKESVQLSAKLRKSDTQKLIIANMKKYLNKEVFICYKTVNGLVLSQSKFVDMGMRDMLLRAAPFYNNDIRLKYENIIHIFTQDGIDLLDVEVKQN